MSYEQARKSIQGHFSDNFDYLESDKIAWDNVEFNIPKKETPWIRVSIQHNESNYVSLGPNRRTRRDGFVFIQIFVPKNDTTLEMTKIIDKVVEVFETKLLSDVVFKSPAVREVGPDNTWFQTNIAVPFYFDDITILS